jgi:hypothetical protein
VILYRCFPWDAAAEAEDPGGPLWFPRRLQGDGRHDAPGRYGCLYVSEAPVSVVVEQLAPFVGTGLGEPDLVRGGLPLALAALELPEDSRLVDLDQPFVLAAARLRPSLVATPDRERSQADAAALHELYPEAVGLRWWSTFEPRWANVTLFDRAKKRLQVLELAKLGLGGEVVEEAAGFLGLRVAA